MVLGVVVVCFPMMFVGWLLLSARWTKMDAVTLRMPEGMRSIVVEAMLEHSSDAKGLQRARKIDADAVKKWQSLDHLMVFSESSNSKLAAIEQAEAANKKTALELNKRGLEQEKAGDECGAEETFGVAAGKSSNGNDYAPVENMGRSALRCGDLPSARAGLETAIIKEDNSLKELDQDDDEAKAAKEDRLKDREFLIVVYQRGHERDLAAGACSEAHPGWKGCACLLAKDGNVKCEDTKR
jgi:hypothetical protein